MPNDKMFYPLQEEFLFDEGKRLNFLSGSVRSGKTHVSLLKWALWVASQPKHYEFLMCGKTITSLNRNCLKLLKTFVGDSFTYSLNQKCGKLFGRVVWLEGANDIKAEDKIRGMTLGGAYCDEITLYPQGFTQMLLSRLSLEDAKLWATCNPDVPSHYIKKDYIDNEKLDCKVWNFLLSDNIFLPKDYIKNIAIEYVGVFYNRFILGQWVRAEGIIYSDFANNTENYLLDEVPRDLMLINIGIDFGGSGSATAFVCTGITQGYKQVVVLEDERITKELDPTMLDNEYLMFIEKCVQKYNKVQYVYCDSAEQILIRGIAKVTERKRIQTSVRNAYKMKIVDRIRLTTRLMGEGRFKVMRYCKNTQKALQDAVWNSKSQSDERLDDGTSDIDTLDALEYSIERSFKQLTEGRRG